MSRHIRALTAVLDCEAVQATTDPTHAKHRRTVALLRAVTGRNGRRQTSATVVVPVAVRIEAGVERRGSWALLGRFNPVDVPLGPAPADRAVQLRRAVPSASVVDVTVAEAAERFAQAEGAVTIYTSDLSDLQALTAASPQAGRIIVVRV